MPVGAFQRDLHTHRHYKKDMVPCQRNISLKHIDNIEAIEGSCIYLKPFIFTHRSSALGIPRSRMTQTPCGGEGMWNSYSSLGLSRLFRRSWLVTTDWNYDPIPTITDGLSDLSPLSSIRSATCTFPAAGSYPKAAQR